MTLRSPFISMNFDGDGIDSEPMGVTKRLLFVRLNLI